MAGVEDDFRVLESEVQETESNAIRHRMDCRSFTFWRGRPQARGLARHRAQELVDSNFLHP